MASSMSLKLACVVWDQIPQRRRQNNPGPPRSLQVHSQASAVSASLTRSAPALTAQESAESIGHGDGSSKLMGRENIESYR
ncbi:hypothetical protein V6N12_025436 [Hibiscus sabdariffa]|uniref:Uncharacterized protein n=1 Tax=Hibiscus sabdariffa TaxID=183260 RepID=A0ABR2CIE3_9ROSI